MYDDNSELTGTRTLSVLFADVSGSTQLYELLGDRDASRLIGRCLRHMEEATLLAHGQPIEYIGDELLATFPTPEAALEGARGMMHRVEQEPPVAGRTMSLRIGSHYGSVLVKQRGDSSHGSIFGDTVNTAARIVGLAKARQILISAASRALLPKHWQAATRDLDVFSLKGKRGDIQIFEVLWDKQEELTIRRNPVMPHAPVELHITLCHDGSTHVLAGSRSRLTVGREPVNDIVIEDRCISRQHAVIERRRDKFVLIDKSTNGSHVTFEDETEIPLHMEEVVLYGKGYISLGRSHQNNTYALAFEVRNGV